MNYSLPTTVDIGGTEYAVRADFRVILDIIEALNDVDLSDAEKAAAAIQMFYPDWMEITDYQEALQKCYSFIDMDDKPQEASPRVMDWQHDWHYIISPINRVLGYEAREKAFVHWWTFLAAYMEIGGDCVLSQIVSIREKLARGIKLDKSEREWLRKNKAIVILPQKISQAERDEFARLGV